MELTLDEQFHSFLWSFALGAVISAVYIVIVVVRELVPPKEIRLFVGDVLFMVFAALMNFIFAAALTNGMVRFYTIFAEIICFGLMYMTIGRLLKNSAAFLYQIICRIYHLVGSFISNVIIKKCVFFIKKCKIVLKKAKK